MFTRKPQGVADLETARREAVRVLNETELTDPNYDKYLQTVAKLSTLISREKPAREPLSWNAVLPVLGTVISVAAIVGHEQTRVVTSKAMQFLPKLIR